MSRTRTRSRRRAALVGLAALSGFLATFALHCSKQTTGGAGGNLEVIPELRDVIFQGGATDEAAYALLNTAAAPDPQLSATFSYPANGAVVPSSPSPTFTWQSGLSSAGRPGPEGWRYTLDDAPRTRDRSLLDWRGRFEHEESPRDAWVAFGVREAYAHGIPMSGPGYFIHFATAANAKLLRVFTANTTYTPDATALARLHSAGRPIQASITNALFTENRIAISGGPYQGATITFTIQ